MIRIHEKQLRDVGRAVALERFEDNMVVHLRRFIPELSARLGEPGVRRCVRFGVARAAGYGVANFGLLRFYVELMVLYGATFDTDPRLPWAGAILCDASITDEATRIDRLYDAMLAHVRAAGEPEKPYSRTALQSLEHVLSEGLEGRQDDAHPR